MNDIFRHVHMPAELVCEFLAVFSRTEYALKASIQFAMGGDDGVRANWDRFANDVNKQFRAIENKEFTAAVDYLLTHPPRKQILQNDALRFADQTINKKQTTAQQALLMVRTVRNNLFHGGKHLPLGEKEKGRNDPGVMAARAIYRVSMDDLVGMVKGAPLKIRSDQGRAPHLFSSLDNTCWSARAARMKQPICPRLSMCRRRCSRTNWVMDA